MSKYRCISCKNEFDKLQEENVRPKENPLYEFGISGSGALVTGGYTRFSCPFCGAGTDSIEMYYGWLPFNYE